VSHEQLWGQVKKSKRSNAEFCGEGLRGVKPFPHCSQTPSRSCQAGLPPTRVWVSRREQALEKT
jgi:hypothetical protein